MRTRKYGKVILIMSFTVYITIIFLVPLTSTTSEIAGFVLKRLVLTCNCLSHYNKAERERESARFLATINANHLKHSLHIGGAVQSS